MCVSLSVSHVWVCLGGYSVCVSECVSCVGVSESVSCVAVSGCV